MYEFSYLIVILHSKILQPLPNPLLLGEGIKDRDCYNIFLPTKASLTSNIAE